MPMSRGFVLSTDALLAVTIAAMLAGGMVVFMQTAPADAYTGNQAIARDFVFLTNAKGLSVNPALLGTRTVTQTAPDPAVSALWSHGELYWPPALEGCPAFGPCVLTRPQADRWLGEQDILDSGVKYHFEAWVKP